MARLPRNDRPVSKELALPTSVVRDVDTLLKDPFTGKTAYGAWSKLVEALLTQWMAGDIKVPGFEVQEISLDDLEVEDENPIANAGT